MSLKNINAVYCMKAELLVDTRVSERVGTKLSAETIAAPACTRATQTVSIVDAGRIDGGGRQIHRL